MLAAAEVRFEYVTEPLELPPEHEAVLALALREAVTNVVRHAGAVSCTVCLTDKGGAAELTVEDDGLGKGAPDGAGLKGMRERVGGLGGTLHVGSREKGTRLVLSLPLPGAPRLETT